MDTSYDMFNGCGEIKKRQIDSNSKLILSMIGAVERTLTRYKQVQDPVIRYSLFLDKFCILLELTLSTIEAITEIDEYPIEVRSKIRELIKDLQNEMLLLANWIQQPYYNPDSYVGEQMMQSAHRDFELKQDCFTKVQSPPSRVQESCEKDCANPIKLDNNPFADERYHNKIDCPDSSCSDNEKEKRV